jgi:hypothetical protein
MSIRTKPAWTLTLLTLILSLSTFAFTTAYAETGSPDKGAITRVKKKLTPPRKKPKSPPSKKEITALPSMPVPYQSTDVTTSNIDVPKAATVLDFAPEPLKSMDVPVPKAQIAPTMDNIHEPSPESVTGTGRQEIILQCDTTLFEGKKPKSYGRFYINLFPSDLIPDHQADFRFFRADPLHQSLIKNTPCQDHMCSAQATGSVFYLHQERRKKSALRLTLDRRSGTFLAEYSLDSRLGDRHLYETGTCQVAVSHKSLF